MELSLKNVIKESENSKVLLMNDANGNLFIKKEIKGHLGSIYEMIKQINSNYFPQIYTIKEENNMTIVVEEYIEGKTLQQILDERTKLSEKEVIEYGVKICSALELLHKQKPITIHRDLKPSNIIITKDGGVKLIDFGISRSVNSYSDKDTVFAGTNTYSAPEQYGFLQTDPRADIYSLGITMYHMYTGKLPNDTAIDCKGKLKSIIKKCIAIDREERYKDTAGVRKDLLAKPIVRNVVISAVVTLAVIIGALFVYNENRPIDGYTKKQLRSVSLMAMENRNGRNVILFLDDDYEMLRGEINDSQFAKGFLPGKLKASYKDEDGKLFELDQDQIIVKGTSGVRDGIRMPNVELRIDNDLPREKTVEAFVEYVPSGSKTSCFITLNGTNEANLNGIYGANSNSGFDMPIWPEFENGVQTQKGIVEVTVMKTSVTDKNGNKAFGLIFDCPIGSRVENLKVNGVPVQVDQMTYAAEAVTLENEMEFEFTTVSQDSTVRIDYEGVIIDATEE